MRLILRPFWAAEKQVAPAPHPGKGFCFVSLRGLPVRRAHLHSLAGLLNGGNDARMGSTAANISLQSVHDFLLVGIGIFLEKRNTADNHSGSAIGALERALIEKSLLYGMKLAVLFEALDGDDGFSRGVADGELAGAPRR